MSASTQRATRTVRAAIGTDAHHGAVVPPLHLSANYVFEAPGRCGQYDYTRSGNPTRDHLARAIADLEGGAGAVVTASGMAAVKVASQLIERGDTVLLPYDCYGGCHRLFRAESARVGYEACFVDQATEDAVELARRLRPAMIWLETPSNPFLRITDIERWASIARQVGAVTVVDNTFLSPALQRPLALGADIVIHSTTKFLNGHSDVVGGALVARSTEMVDRLSWWANCIGATGSPFDAYQTLRGLRTLFARSETHERNALAVVEALRRETLIEALHHPSLASHPGHEIARRQQSGWGSIISLELAGGRPAVDAFVEALECFNLAESLGGVESLVTHPATMTHASMTSEAQREAGIHEGLIRLSVGIEDRRDLIQDLTQALTRAEEVACHLAT